MGFNIVTDLHSRCIQSSSFILHHVILESYVQELLKFTFFSLINLQLVSHNHLL